MGSDRSGDGQREPGEERPDGEISTTRRKPVAVPKPLSPLGGLPVPPPPRAPSSPGLPPLSPLPEARDELLDGLTGEVSTMPPEPETQPPAGSSDYPVTVDLSTMQPTGRATLPPEWAPIAGREFGRYELLGRLATGGMAEVYLARERTEGGVDRHLVVKVVKPSHAEDIDFIKLFQDEGRLAMQLNHPHICHVYEYGQEHGRYFIAMEWVNGRAIGQIAKRCRRDGAPLPLPVALRIASDIAEALDYAHGARDTKGRHLGVVHRDVSPHNIMVSYSGHVKLLDFGVAMARQRLTTTQAGVVRGKFAYMSPQQCLGASLDGRSDIFSLGVCLYEMVTGETLYERPTEFEMMKLIIEGDVPDPREVRPDLPDALVDIIRTALAKEPEDRYATAGEMQQAIASVLFDLREAVSAQRLAGFMRSLYAAEIQAGPRLTTDTELLDRLPTFGSESEPVPTPIEPAAQPAKPEPAPRRRGLLLVVAALAVALIGVLAFVLTRPEPPPQTHDPPDPVPNVSPDPVQPDPVRPDPVQPDPVQQAPSTGGVRIVSNPPGASVEIDGEDVEGETPLTVGELSEGEHRITVRLPRYDTQRRTVEVVAGEVLDVEVELEEGAPPASLAINTRPWSRVYIGGRLLGTTPIARARVPSGVVRLRLVDGEGRTHRKSVRLSGGEHRSLFYDLTN